MLYVAMKHSKVRPTATAKKSLTCEMPDRMMLMIKPYCCMIGSDRARRRIMHHGQDTARSGLLLGGPSVGSRCSGKGAPSQAHLSRPGAARRRPYPGGVCGRLGRRGLGRHALRALLRTRDVDQPSPVLLWHFEDAARAGVRKPAIWARVWDLSQKYEQSVGSASDQASPFRKIRTAGGTHSLKPDCHTTPQTTFRPRAR